MDYKCTYCKLFHILDVISFLFSNNLFYEEIYQKIIYNCLQSSL